MSHMPSQPQYELDNPSDPIPPFPSQGDWSEEAYFKLTNTTNARFELTDGRLESAAMPTEIHEALVRALFLALYAFVDSQKLGQVYGSSLRVRIRKNKIRQPDVLFLHKDHYHLRHNRAWDGADLVIEVVSDDPKDRVRDYEQKLADYAEGNVPEYWIVDPLRRVVLVHELANGKCLATTEHRVGTRAVSKVLTGFENDVEKLFAVMDEIPD